MDAASRSRYERRVRELVGFGHRGSATEGERQAAAYLANELLGLGLEPVTEPFTGSRSLGTRLLLHVGICAAGAELLWHLPGLTVILGSVALCSLTVDPPIGHRDGRGRWSRPSHDVSNRGVDPGRLRCYRHSLGRGDGIGLVSRFRLSCGS
jgi:hypothetical protein